MQRICDVLPNFGTTPHRDSGAEVKWLELVPEMMGGAGTPEKGNITR